MGITRSPVLAGAVAVWAADLGRGRGFEVRSVDLATGRQAKVADTPAADDLIAGDDLCAWISRVATTEPPVITVADVRSGARRQIAPYARTDGRLAGFAVAGRFLVWARDTGPGTAAEVLSYDVDTGLRIARRLLLAVNQIGMPAATEFLDPIVPQYIADLVSWAAIGARTTESQTHREMASGLSMPVGFKNGTDGSLQTAMDAMISAKHPHHFLGMDEHGAISVVQTTGNEDAHVVLRGGRNRTNYDAASIAEAAGQLRKAHLPPVVMVDCSHANSLKQHARQEDVWWSVVDQRLAGDQAIMGVMLESHLHEGSQPLKDPKALQYGVSITDACLNWEATERMLLQGAERLRKAEGVAVAR